MFNDKEKNGANIRFETKLSNSAIIATEGLLKKAKEIAHKEYVTS